jgi:hypothetical protein
MGRPVICLSKIESICDSDDRFNVKNNFGEFLGEMNTVIHHCCLNYVLFNLFMSEMKIPKMTSDILKSGFYFRCFVNLVKRLTTKGTLTGLIN